MKILVTGGAGFIGSHIVHALVARGDQVTVLDDLSSGQRQNLAEIASQITLIEGDIRDAAIVRRAVQGVECILHQAALRSVPKSMTRPVEYHEVNVTGTLNILLAARDAQVRRVVLASSSSVYGESQQYPQREDQSTIPVSPYAMSKWMGEQYCQLFSRMYGVETVGLRYFNVFGPRQSLENDYAVVIPRFIVSLLQGQSPPIYGDGQQSRDFTYVDNVVQANLLACAAPQASGRVFNIACGDSVSVLDLLRAVQQVLKKTTPPTHLPKRPGDVLKSQADISQARQVLGYEPRITFTEGLRRTAAWFAEHA